MRQQKWLQKMKGNSLQWAALASPIAEFAAFAIGSFILLMFFRATFIPTVGIATYKIDDGPESRSHMPITLQSHGKLIAVTLPVTIPPSSSKIFWIHPDDCIESIDVNGKKVDGSDGKFCGDNKKVNLDGYVQNGSNVLHIVVKDTGGIGELRFVPEDAKWSFMATMAIWMLLLLWATAFFLGTIGWVARNRLVLSICFAGAILRICYMLSTAFTVRSHDYDGHIDYIMYVFKNWGIPRADAGWEFHQAPLYYLLSGSWMQIGTWIGRGEAQLLHDLQWFSCALSIMILVCGVWAGARLLGDRHKMLLPYFAGILAAFPALVYTAAPLSNDVLYQALAFLAFAILLEWWRNNREGFWLLACAVAALALIAKMSGLLVIVLLYSCLLFRPGIQLMEKIRMGAVGLALIILLAGWYPLLRLSESSMRRTLTLGNEGMNHELLVPNDALHYLVFNPVKILQIPFNNSWDNASRREYFWEYFYRSAFFGESSYDAQQWITGNILFIGLTLLALGLFGFLEVLINRFRKAIPALSAFGIILAGGIAYRLFFPYAPNQDFRFSLLCLVPAVYFALYGIDRLPDDYKPAARIWAGLFAASCAVFILALCSQA